MKTCDVCGKEIPVGDKRRKFTCSKKCSKIYKDEQRKKRAREYQRKVRKKCIEMGLTVKEFTALRKKALESNITPIKRVRVWYDRGLFIDWSEGELERIKLVKDKAYV